MKLWHVFGIFLLVCCSYEWHDFYGTEWPCCVFVLEHKNIKYEATSDLLQWIWRTQNINPTWWNIRKNEHLRYGVSFITSFIDCTDGFQASECLHAIYTEIVYRSAAMIVCISQKGHQTYKSPQLCNANQ